MTSLIIGASRFLDFSMNNVFKWIRPVNGIALLGIATLLLSLMAVDTLASDADYDVASVINIVKANAEGGENWVFGEIDKVKGLPFRFIPLLSENGKADAEKRKINSSGSSEQGQSAQYSKNILFINRSNSETKWLFGDSEQIILDVGQQTHQNLDIDGTPTLAMLYNVILEDTDGDGLITTDDNPALAYSQPDGSGFEVLLTGHEKTLATQFEDDGTVLIIFRQSGSAYIGRYSLNPVTEIYRTKMANQQKSE
jgi:hypothetical protein